MPEHFDGGLHRSASGPNIIQKQISSVGIKMDGVFDSVSLVGLSDAFGAAGTYLHSIVGANKELGDLVVWALLG